MANATMFVGHVAVGDVIDIWKSAPRHFWTILIFDYKSTTAVQNFLNPIAVK
jgi:hypothetical protein